MNTVDEVLDGLSQEEMEVIAMMETHVSYPHSVGTVYRGIVAIRSMSTERLVWLMENYARVPLRDCVIERLKGARL